MSEDTVLDARGLSCPQPVLLTLDALRKQDSDNIVVLVDTEASKENVIRAAGSRGWQTRSVTEEEGTYRVDLERAGGQ